MRTIVMEVKLLAWGTMEEDANRILDIFNYNGPAIVVVKIGISSRIEEGV